MAGLLRRSGDPRHVHAVHERLAAGQGPRTIAAELAAAAGRPKREVYARALALRDET